MLFSVYLALTLYSFLISTVLRRFHPSLRVKISQLHLSLIGWICYSSQIAQAVIGCPAAVVTRPKGFFTGGFFLSPTHVEVAANGTWRTEQSRGQSITASLQASSLSLFFFPRHYWGNYPAYECNHVSLRTWAVEEQPKRGEEWSGKHLVEILSDNSICSAPRSLPGNVGARAWAEVYCCCAEPEDRSAAVVYRLFEQDLLSGTVEDLPVLS